MIVTSSASSKTSRSPRTLLPCASVTFTFDTGHRLSVYNDGTRCHSRRNGGALNPRTGHKLVAKMDEAADLHMRGEG